jgi:hypothetical protein
VNLGDQLANTPGRNTLSTARDDHGWSAPTCDANNSWRRPSLQSRPVRTAPWPGSQSP